MILAGRSDRVEPVAARLRAAGVPCEDLPFGRAYHTPAFAAAAGPIRDFFGAMEIGRPALPLYSCCLGGRVEGDGDRVRRLAAAQWTRPVEFRRTVEAMHADGLRVFVDVGAGATWPASSRTRSAAGTPFAVAAHLPRRSGLTQLNHLVATLFARGVALDPVRPLRPPSPVARRPRRRPSRPRGRPCRCGSTSRNSGSPRPSPPGSEAAARRPDAGADPVADSLAETMPIV